jgi:hypothetical protein
MAEYELTQLDRVWNRACDTFPREPLEAGDRALRDLLRAHGAICNGGVFFVFDALSPVQIQAAKAGYRFFELPEVADLLGRARDFLDKGVNIGENESTFDFEYARYVPGDSDLVNRFKKHFAAKPTDFAPLTPDDRPPRPPEAKAGRL